MADKPIHITGHARFEMKRRRIGKAQVEAAIRAPGQVMASVKGRSIYQTLIGAAQRLLLHVDAKEDPHVYHVITAYKTSKVAKYWKTS